MSNNKRIIFTRPDGGVSIIVPAPGVPDSVWMKDIPHDAINPTATIVDDIPQDRIFREGWKQEGRKCVEDLTKCREIAHKHRRAAREEEFKPLDEAIAKQLPGKKDSAEASRSLIRMKYDSVQTELDHCGDVEGLKFVLEKHKCL